jgi:hypothetical protein
LDGGILCACGTREDDDESSARALRACALDSESGPSQPDSVERAYRPIAQE